MHPASSKLAGRGGVRGGGANPKRLSSSFPPPPPLRPSGPTSSRLPLNLRTNHRTPSSAASAAAVEESFSLVPGNNFPAFSMIIRLAPDLVDEIKRAESQGGSARVRFGPVPANPTGNVIDVGGKEFKFTWSKEFGDLCDIYEERQSGEDGNGLMVESGCAWRKVTVQRILDESTKNHVKMRSEEAERKMKSRKAIVLEPGNPSMKNQIKQLQAVEANPWMRMPFKQKKEPPFKKRKVEPPPVGGPPKSSFKPGLAATSSAKSRRSSSPLPSPPERSGTPASPFTAAGIAKSQLSTEEISVTQRKGKESASTVEKENPTRANSVVQETPGRKWNPGAKSVELESMLITLLTENPKGMKLKDIEKAIDDTIPNPAKKIEPILKKIANVQAPGKYVLKPGMELESFKKPSSESGSSPEDIRQHAQTPEEKHRHRHSPEPTVAEKSPAKLEELSQLGSKLGEPSASKKIDIEQQSPYIFGEKVDNSGRQVASSSDSGTDSDSESDSSDSGSDSVSRSRSRSRSPAESGSWSSSDSESDVSSSGKEGSDEDVDIMTSDDDNDPQKQLQPSEPAISASPDPFRSIPNGTDDKQDGDESDAVDIEGRESDAVDIEKDFLDKKEAEIAAKESMLPAEEGVDGAKSFHSAQARQTFLGSLFDDNEPFEKESDRHEHSDSSEMTSKGKSKRRSDMKYGDRKSDRAKGPKVESIPHASVSGGRDAQSLEDPDNMLTVDTHKGPENQMMNRADRDGHGDFGSRKGNNQAFHGKSNSDFQQTERRPFDQNAWGKAPDTAGRSKNAENMGHGHKFPEKVNHVHDSFPPQREKSSRDIHNEDNLVKEKKGSRNPKEGGRGGRHSAPFEYDYRKQGEVFGKFKDAAQVTNSHMVSPKDNNKADADKHTGTSGRGLQRELSDLEMGELREPLPEEKPVKKQFDRKGSFKQSENKPSTSDNYNPDIIKGKYGGKSASDLGKPSPNTGAGVKQTPEHHNEAIMKSRHKNAPSQPQHISRADAHEIASQVGKLADANSRLKQSESGQKLGNGVESNKKAPITGQHFQDSKREVTSQSAVETKTQTPHSAADLTDGRMDTKLTKGGRRKRGSSSEEDSFSYSKFEKDEPDLKGPIKDLSQYNEYAMEYRDKYDAYSSVDKILENYRNEFLKMGKDLELAKNRDPDRYNKIVGQLRESYRQCGTKHKRLKKVFIILHKELKSLKQRMKDFAQLHTTE